jgi:ATP-dependent RNA helicase DeaD
VIKKNSSGLDIGDLEELKSIYKKSSEKTTNARPERKYTKRSSDQIENVGRINIKGEGSTKAWYVGEDSDTMNISKAEKKKVKAQNKKRSLDYLQDMSDLVMESFGKRKNREKK